jgi:hypothetical protein
VAFSSGGATPRAEIRTVRSTAAIMEINVAALPAVVDVE